jgi:nucleoside-diphosphate-sugar epimerase
VSDLQILVLGSEGAIGTHLVAMLHKSMPSASIVRVSRTFVTDPESSTADKVLVGDLLDAKFVASIFEENSIQVVIFCAAKWNGLNQDPTVLDVNVTMFNNVLSFLTKSVSNFIYLSSSAVYCDDVNVDTQNLKTLPTSTYGKSKLINEILLSNKAELDNFSTTIYRPFHVVSPAEKYLPGRSHITTDFTHRYIELECEFNWESLRDDVFIPFYWVDDLCKVIVENMFNQKFSGKIFNIGSSNSYSIIDLAKSVAKIANKHGLSSKNFPEINGKLVPVDTGFLSQLDAIITRDPDRELEDVVELFIIEKYRLPCKQ